MATFVNDLRLTELATGEGSGTWGTTTNQSLELIGEALGYATQEVFSSDADATTTIADGASDPARAMYFKITSAGSLTATRTCTIAPNTVSRVMFIENATTGSQSIAISQGSGANVTILTGKTAVVYLDGAGSGAAVVDAMAGVDPGVTDTLTEVLVAGNTTGGTNVELSTTDKVQFRDAALYINSSVDGQLDIVADTEIQIAATTVDVNGTLAFDSLKGTGATTVTNILDEDNMASDSATAIATQQSIKAYVDSLAGTIADGSVTTVKLADDAVTASKLASDSVVTDSILDDAVTASKLASDSVVTDSILDDAVTASKIANATITGANVSSEIKVAGLETIYVPAAGMYPNTTAGCADLEQVELANGPELKCLDFDASSDENAQFTVCFPKSWNEGTVTFQAFWTVTGTNTGTVAWGLSGGCIADDASINTAFGTNVVATAKAFSGTSNDMTVSATSGAVTIANAAVDTQAYFQIMRDVSADTQTGDARLLGIKLLFTTDASNDA